MFYKYMLTKYQPFYANMLPKIFFSFLYGSLLGHFRMAQNFHRKKTATCMENLLVRF